MTLCDSCSPRKQCTAEKNRTECKYYQTMTNEEWLRQASTEQLAEFLSTIVYFCEKCGVNDGHSYCHTDGCIREKEYAMRWLKQPHTIKE